MSGATTRARTPRRASRRAAVDLPVPQPKPIDAHARVAIGLRKLRRGSCRLDGGKDGIGRRRPDVHLNRRERRLIERWSARPAVRLSAWCETAPSSRASSRRASAGRSPRWPSPPARWGDPGRPAAVRPAPCRSSPAPRSSPSTACRRRRPCAGARVPTSRSRCARPRRRRRSSATAPRNGARRRETPSSCAARLMASKPPAVSPRVSHRSARGLGVTRPLSAARSGGVSHSASV